MMDPVRACGVFNEPHLHVLGLVTRNVWGYFPGSITRAVISDCLHAMKSKGCHHELICKHDWSTEISFHFRPAICSDHAIYYVHKMMFLIDVAVLSIIKELGNTVLYQDCVIMTVGLHVHNYVSTCPLPSHGQLMPKSNRYNNIQLNYLAHKMRSGMSL